MVAIHCPLCCDQPFEDQQALFFHLRGLRNNLYCPVCSDKFSTLELLVSHLSRACNGPLSPSEAKRRCVSTIALHDQSDFEDEASKNENQLSKTQTDNVKHQSQIAIPGRLLKNVSISIKENKSNDQHTRMKPVQPVVVAVDPRNPSITNGLPLHSTIKNVGLNSSLDITLGTTNNQKQTDNNNACANLITTPLKALEIMTNANAQTSNDTQPEESESSESLRKRGRPRKMIYNRLPVNSTLESNSEKKRGRPRKYTFNRDETEIHPQTKAPFDHVLESVVNKTLSVGTSSKVPGDSPQKSNLESSTVNNNVINSNLPLCDDLRESNDAFGEHRVHNDESQENIKHTGSASNNEALVVKQDVSAAVPNTLNPKDSSEDASKVESEDEYTCSACNVRFLSIYEHIKEYHYGQEVVVEVPENEIKEDLKAYQSEKAPIKAGDVAEGKGDLPIAKVEETTNVHAENDVETIKDNDTHSTRAVMNTSKLSLDSGPSKQTQLVSRDSSKQFSILVKQINKLKRSRTGDWLRTQGIKRSCYHFVNDADKMLRLVNEFKGNNNLHPVFQVPIKDLFENPKINVIAITNKPNTPIFTNKEVDLNVPIPMYIVARKHSKPDGHLGGLASYVITNPCRDSSSSDVLEDAKVIAVMNVILGSDQTFTVENLVFKNKPGIESIIPVLEDIYNPEIPLLKGGKLLKWMCKKCLAVTWKFPLNKDSHLCNGCLICHKPFSTRIGLQKHMLLHKKNSATYCETCHLAFINSKLLENHQAEHENNILCPICKLFVPLYQQQKHEQLHKTMPANQFPCSICHKLFISEDEIKAHEVKSCGRLVAKYNCSLCDKKFFSLTSLSYHTQEHKFVTIKFPCRFCPKTFIKEKEQIWHERIHTKDRPFLCSACPKRFRSLDHQTIHSHQAHSTSKHKDVPIHMCSFCDKVFTNEKKLIVHKNKFHLVK